MATIPQSLRIVNGDCKNPVSIMDIRTSTGSWPDTGMQGPYDDRITCLNNVRIVHNRIELINLFENQEQDPLIVYHGTDGALPELLLLEDKKYYVMIRSNEGHSLGECLYNLEDTGADLDDISPGDSDSVRMFSINFRGYVGRGSLDISVDGIVYELPVEVRSSKIEYLEQYPRMLSEISEFSISMTLDSDAPLLRDYGMMERPRETYYEDFLLLDHIMGKMGFANAFEYVSRHRHTDLYSEEDERDDCATFSLDTSSVIHLVSGNHVLPFDCGCIGNVAIPTRTMNIVTSETSDTPENRMVKDLLLAIHDILEGIHESGVTCNGYVSRRLDEMRDEITSFMHEPWLHDIGRLNRIPFGSNVLMSHQGYRDLFRIYLMLEMGLSMERPDETDILEGRNQKVHAVYEYWCYTRLFSVLAKLSNGDFHMPPPIKNSRRWVQSLNGNTKPAVFRIGAVDGDLLIKLYYNLSTGKGSCLESYSLKLRPDFTLLMEYGGRTRIIHFDAKYRMHIPDWMTFHDDPKNTFQETDIYKMHTYRDAILGCWGSYVLYPGDELRWFSRRHFIDSIDDDIPSVGAIPLTPCEDGDHHLERVMKRLVELVASIEVREVLME